GGERRCVGAGHVAAVHEMLGLRAIANDARTLAAPNPIVRLDDVERVGGAVVLALAIDGGIAQGDVVEAALQMRVAAELLADDLAGAVQNGGGRRPRGME